MPVPMGIGRLGFDNTVFKRKFRYTFELFNICGGQRMERWYVKSAARPNLNIEETEINVMMNNIIKPTINTAPFCRDNGAR